jgi:hypothetical protein
MNNVFYKPWVGKNYLTSGIIGKRILILGESHYCNEGCGDCGNSLTQQKCHNNFTRNVIEAYINYKIGNGEFENWMNTFTRFGNIFYNKKLSVSEVKEFWDSVLFYNYVQFATPMARVSPKLEAFEKSESAFFDVLKHFEPNVIIAWGDRLWENLPANGEFGEEIIAGKLKGKLFYYTVNEKRIPLFNIYHPSSSAFNYSSHPYIQRALELI